MQRRQALKLLAGGAILSVGTAVVPAARAAQPFKIYMITYRGETAVERGFWDYLAANGVAADYVHRDVGRDVSKLPGLIDEIRSLQPDLVYTWGTPVTLGLVGPFDGVNPDRHVTKIPVVFALVSAPLKSRIVPDLDHPGRNVTGAVHVVPPAVQLRAMQSYRSFDRLGVVYTQTEQNSVAIVAELRRLQGELGFRLIERTFNRDVAGRPTANGVEELIASIKTDGADWLYLLPDTFLGTIYDRVTPAALQQRLPTFGAAELAIREGGALVGLVSRYYSVGQLAASKAREILVGGRAPGDIPVETLRRFSLIVNMKVARQLSFYPPLAMLNYAEVIVD